MTWKKLSSVRKSQIDGMSKKQLQEALVRYDTEHDALFESRHYNLAHEKRIVSKYIRERLKKVGNKNMATKKKNATDKNPGNGPYIAISKDSHQMLRSLSTETGLPMSRLANMAIDKFSELDANSIISMADPEKAKLLARIKELEQALADARSERDKDEEVAEDAYEKVQRPLPLATE